MTQDNNPALRIMDENTPEDIRKKAIYLRVVFRGVFDGLK
jgi:hypothetical protein